MTRFLRWLRGLRQAPVHTPVARTGQIYDPAFVRASFRPGETVNPFAATIEE